MAKLDNRFSAKGELFQDEDGRLKILEITKDSEEIVDVQMYLDSFMGKEVTFVVQESKKVVSDKREDE